MEKMGNDVTQHHVLAMKPRKIAGISAHSTSRSHRSKDDRVKKAVRPSKATEGSPLNQRSSKSESESESEYRCLFDGAQDGIVCLDPNTGTILEANPYLCKMLDYPQAYFPGKALCEFGLFADTEASTKAFQGLKKRKFVRYDDLPLKRRDGRLMSVELVCNVCRVRGKQLIQCHIRDTSARKNCEERGQRLLQAQKMEAVGQLAGGMAHDFNNLLQVILGYSEILQARVDLPEPVRTMIGAIQEAGASAKSLTHRLLTFSHQQVPESAILNLNEAVSRIQMLLGGLIGDGIDLVSSLDQDLGAIKADPHQIDQVLMNLTINARDAMPEGGKVTFETANVVIDDNYVSQRNRMKHGRYVRLIVRDTGTGMDLKTQGKIFDPFFTTKGLDKGTGLGLSTVYSIVKQSGGTIAVWSEPGHGTRFTLYFPRFDEATVASKAVKAESLRGGTETILLVDDAPSSRILLKILLEKHGYRVLESGHPDEALRLARELKAPLPLMITDISMPGFSGPVLADRLAADRPETRVIYISGSPEGAAARHGIQGPGFAFLEKPFSCEDLVGKVRQVLDLPTDLTA